MQRDRKARLVDVLEAAAAIERFTNGLDVAMYGADALVQSGVMYQLMVIGEALNLLSREDPELAAHVPEVHDAVGMRNMLIHGYEIVDHEVVWATIHEDLPRLSGVVLTLLAELDAAAGSQSSEE